MSNRKRRRRRRRRMVFGQNRGGAESIEELDTNSYVIHKTNAVPLFSPLIKVLAPAPTPTMVAPALVGSPNGPHDARIMPKYLTGSIH